jgi:hypothetical protein
MNVESTSLNVKDNIILISYLLGYMDILTQIENVYTKLMGNNHIQNLEKKLSSSCLMQLAAPFIQKSLALRRVDSI